MGRQSGLNNETSEFKYYTDTNTYVDSISQNGSDIVAVNGTQIGNQTIAQVEIFKAYDAYIDRGIKPVGP